MPTYKGTSYTLKKRGDSFQVDFRYTDPAKGAKRDRTQRPTEEEARKYVEATIDRLEAGLAAQPPTTAAFATPTLRKVYDLVYAARWKGSKGERSAKLNAMDCLKVIGEDTPIDQVTTEVVDHLITELKDRGIAGGTVRRKLAALSTILKFAASRHMIAGVPLIDRQTAGKERKRLRYLSDEEEAQALTYLKYIGKNDEFFAFLIDTGLRLSEAVELRKSKLKFENGEPAFITFDYSDNKGEQPRVVPCTGRVTSILKGRLARMPEGEQRVWWDMTADKAEWEWKLLREHMKLTYDKTTDEGDRDFVIHACRHTFASRLAQAGTPLNVIQALGGWKTLDMVLRYAHLNTANSVKAIREVEQQRKVS